MGLREIIKNWLFPDALTPDIKERIKTIGQRRDYRRGFHKSQLYVKPNQYDDNITINYTGLIVDKSVSLLFGKGIEFEHPDESAKEWLDACWDANKQEILLHKMGEYGAEDGTVFVRLLYDPAIEAGAFGKDGMLYPRMIVLDPMTCTIQTQYDDIEVVTSYTIEFAYKDDAGRDAIHKQVIKRGAKVWIITDYEIRHPAYKEVQVGPPVNWEHNFPPLLHWQNLPRNDSAYGVPDITDDVINLQNKVNFTASNIAKIIRMHAHPQFIAKGVSKGDIETGPDKVVYLPNPDTDFTVLEMQSDLASSSQFLQTLTQSMFNTTQSVNISSTLDKVGALTNFGLHVLYQDAVARISVKRELYGDAIIELNRRLCILAGKGDNGGELTWPDMLPEDELGKAQALQLDMNMQIVDKETAAEIRGYDWDTVSERMSNQQKDANMNNDNVGAAVLRAFAKGGNVPGNKPAPGEKPPG